MKAISLFSGCGGMDIGATQAGAKVVYANDIDRLACQSLRDSGSFEGEVVCDDIANIKSFPEADLVMAGYPCQSFSMGGKRNPDKDKRTQLYEHLTRCLDIVQPKYFIAENVSGLRSLKNGHFLEHQKQSFSTVGQGYKLNVQLLNAKDYGIPQNRKRLFIIGVRNDLGQEFIFPEKTHGPEGSGLVPYTSHGDVIRDLPIWPVGEFYERSDSNNFSWYFMSRNRKALWHGPSFTIVANWRHITLHPASPRMYLHSSNLADGFKQEWRFSNEYEHTQINSSLPQLESSRRLSWRECSLIQTFPGDFEPVGSIQEKFTQIGNAVPPQLARILVTSIISGQGLVTTAKAA